MSPSTKRRKLAGKRDWRKLVIRFFRNLLLIALSILAVYYFSQSPFFALKEIEAKGNTKVTQEEIVRKSGLSPGINYFELDTHLVKKRLLSMPLVETVTVKKRLPDRVVIDIKEREALALFCAQESFVVIDGRVPRSAHIKRHSYHCYVLSRIQNQESESKEQPPGTQLVLSKDVQHLVL